MIYSIKINGLRSLDLSKGYMKILQHLLLIVFSTGLLILLAACGPSVAGQNNSQQTVTISKSFQSQASPVATAPPYRCGAWSSNNAPGPFSTITIYARLTKNIAPVSGANASAVVHFKGFDQPLDAQGPSDKGGYVTFNLPLQGHQPTLIPATVDVTFSNIPGGPSTLHCTPAFFTPM